MNSYDIKRNKNQKYVYITSITLDKIRNCGAISEI